MRRVLPLIISLLMVLMATTWRVSWWRPLKTSPNCPFPITSSSTYLSITFGIYQYNINPTPQTELPRPQPPHLMKVNYNTKMIILLACLLLTTHAACPAGSYTNSALDLCLVCSPGCLACCDENLCSSCDTGTSNHNKDTSSRKPQGSASPVPPTATSAPKTSPASSATTPPP